VAAFVLFGVPKGWTLDSRHVRDLQRLDRLFAGSRFGTPFCRNLNWHSNRSRTGVTLLLGARDGRLLAGSKEWIGHCLHRQRWFAAIPEINVTKDQLKELSQTRHRRICQCCMRGKNTDGRSEIGSLLRTNLPQKGWVQNLDLRCIGGFLSRRARR